VKPFKVLDTQIVGRWGGMHVIRDELELPDGRKLCKHSVRHPGAVVIIPRQQDGSLLMVHQYRHAVGKHLLEFPAGTLEPTEPPLACAQRELIEEVGHRAGHWRELGTILPAPGFCDEIQHCFLAENLTPEAGELDEDEFIEVRVTTVADLETAIAEMHISDGKTLALFARARALGAI
jgi:ADP-ribose pyrophosphatase